MFSQGTISGKLETKRLEPTKTTLLFVLMIPNVLFPELAIVNTCDFYSCSVTIYHFFRDDGDEKWDLKIEIIWKQITISVDEI